MHVNVRTTLHDRKTTLSQTRSPEIKAKKPESFLRRADPEKKFKNIKRETIQNLCWWPWCTQYSKSVFILNSFIPLPEGYLLCCSYTQHYCQICWFWHEMHIMVEKTQTYISQYWEHLMTTKPFQIPWCRTYELTRAKITPTKQKFGTVGGAHQSERSRSMGSGRIISRYEWVLCWTESLNLAQKAETYHRILRLAIHWHNSSTILQGGDFLCWKDEKQALFCYAIHSFTMSGRLWA